MASSLAEPFRPEPWPERAFVARRARVPLKFVQSRRPLFAIDGATTSTSILALKAKERLSASRSLIHFDCASSAGKAAPRFQLFNSTWLPRGRFIRSARSLPFCSLASPHTHTHTLYTDS